MPKRLTIEIVRHSLDDIRIVSNANGNRYRGYHNDDEDVLRTVRALLRLSGVVDDLEVIGG